MRNRRVTNREAEGTDLFSSSLIFGNVGGGVSDVITIIFHLISRFFSVFGFISDLACMDGYFYNLVVEEFGRSNSLVSADFFTASRISADSVVVVFKGIRSRFRAARL